MTTVVRGSGKLKLAQELARHANIQQVTQRYTHLSVLKSKIEKFNLKMLFLAQKFIDLWQNPLTGLGENPSHILETFPIFLRRRDGYTLIKPMRDFSDWR